MTDAGLGPEGTDGSDAAPSRSPWLTRLALGMGAGAIVGGLVLTLWLGRYLRDDWVLDGVVRAVALDWRDFGEPRARERLQVEIDRRGIGDHVGDDSCTLATLDDGVLEVRCAWGVPVAIPGAGMAWRVPFESVARVDRDGDLR